MKLEKIHFRNLASLSGEWEIDLTDPLLLDAGIFAMAGPVGSGKTTVFDAVRLALFGRTSRLSRISRNENEIMTVGTRECFAELIFSCPAGRFLCRWSQHRAKSGQLQNAQHFLAQFHGDSEKAEILTSKLEETRDRIRSVTGMDFNHFSRAVILPQGQFAGFLQAGAEERSPILEQITGTGIYAEISKKVYDTFRTLSQELEMLGKAAENIELVPSEQIETWKSEIENLKKSAAELRVKYDSGTEQLSSRKNLEIERSALAHLKIEQPDAEHDLQLARLSLADAERGFRAASDSFASLLSLLRRIRELDSRIGMGTEALEELESSIAQRESRKNSDLAVLEQNQKDLLEKKSLLAQIADSLEKNKNDSVLSSELSGLENRCKAAASLLDEADAVKCKLLAIKESADHQEQISELLKKKFVASESSLTKLKKEFEDRKKELDIMTGGSSLPEFFQKKESIRQRKEILEQMVSFVKREKELETGLAGLKVRAESSMKHSESLSSQLAVRKKLTEQIEETLHAAEKNRLMEAKIAAYEKDRKTLADGQKCPLCGSEHHPYLKHAPVLTAEDECGKYRKQLKESEEAEAVIEKELLDETLARTSLENEIRQLSAERSRIAESWHAIPRQEPEEDRSDPLFLSKLESEFRKVNDELSSIQSAAGEIDRKMKENSSLERKISRMGESHIQIQLDLKGSETKRSALLVQQEHAEAELTARKDAAEKEAESFRIRLSQFGIAAETPFKDALKLLKNRSKLYESQMVASIALEKDLIGLQTSIAAETARIENEKNAITLQRAESAKRKQSLALLKKNREAEFGSKSPDAEEKLAEETVKAAETRKKESAEAVKRTEERCSLLRSRMEDTQKRIDRLEAFLSAADVLRIPLETLEQQIGGLNLMRQEQDRRIGELVSKLDHAVNCRKRAAELAGQIEEKRRECAKWEYLNALIGSADGKKYRDFVQSLTLEKLIVSANEQLRHFTDRYTLISDPKTGLDFNVADSYRGNEIRSSRNLSGGETFLVSLALALGLSHMTHSTIRIDTLFLDEGFGTLDEESLQNALEQLAGLRRSGKLIGIITHAHGVEDTVPVVLRFTNHGGYSTISGPGVRQKSDVPQDQCF